MNATLKHLRAAVAAACCALGFAGAFAQSGDDHVDQPSPGSAVLPLNGGTVEGAISFNGDADFFRIEITQAGTIVVKTLTATMQNSGPWLLATLTDAQGRQLVDPSGKRDAMIGHVAPFYNLELPWVVQPGTYYLKISDKSGRVATDPRYKLNVRFTPQAVNYSALWWAGPAESGWGVNLNHQGETIFATLFTYEATAEGNRNRAMWLPGTLRRTGDKTFEGKLLRTRGPSFDALPFVSIREGDMTEVGTMKVTFDDAENASLSYSLNGGGTGGTGAMVNKSIKRQHFAAPAECIFTTNRLYSTNFQDMWWNNHEAGWGLSLAHEGNSIFAVLYSYEKGSGYSNKDEWHVATMTGTSSSFSKVFEGDLLRTTGPAFNAAPFTPLAADNVRKVGRMSITFQGGDGGFLLYSIDDSEVYKFIRRQAFDEFSPDCK